MSRGDPVTFWHWEDTDYAGRTVKFDVSFNTTTKAITNPGLTGTRDAGCVYTRILIGPLNPDTGEPIDPAGSVPIPEGAFSVSRAQLSQRGYVTIDDISNTQFTLGR